jgi:hypothetical protein
VGTVKLAQLLPDFHTSAVGSTVLAGPQSRDVFGHTYLHTAHKDAWLVQGAHGVCGVHLQVSDKERQAQQDNLFKDVAGVLVEKTVRQQHRLQTSLSAVCTTLHVHLCLWFSP